MQPIFIVNNSNFSNDDLMTAVNAVQAQLDGPYQTAWRDTATLTVVDPANPPPAGAIVLSVEQTSDVSGALGYHDVDASGVPYGKVFVDDSAAAGVALSSVISHEILEMAADLYVQALALQDNGDGTGTLYALEDCDPVEADMYTDENGVQLSNFVFPAWFIAGSSGPWDAAGNLSGPFTMTAGGYVATRSVGQLGPWQQNFADKSKTRSLFGK